MGKLVEWPEVVTEGIDLDEYRLLLRDALIEQIPVKVALVHQSA